MNTAKFLRAPPVAAASCKIRTKFLKSAEFQFQLFLTILDIMGTLYIVTYNISCKMRYLQKIICGGVHSYSNSNFKNI